MKTPESALRKALPEGTPFSAGYVWEVPLKPVAVRIPFAVIDRLELQAVESFRSLTARGSEVGGLLLGSFTDGAPTLVTVQNFELITCDYDRGPLYRLSDADMRRLDEALQRAGSRAVGYFRTHTRKGLALEPDDVSLLEARFRDPRQIALLVRPFATKSSVGGIFIRENGAVRAEASYLEFPFRSSELAATNERAPMQPAAMAAPTHPTATSRGPVVHIRAPHDVLEPPVDPVAPEEPAAPVSDNDSGIEAAPNSGTQDQFDKSLNAGEQAASASPAEDLVSNSQVSGGETARADRTPNRGTLPIQKLAVRIAEYAGWLTMYEEEVIREYLNHS